MVDENIRTFEALRLAYKEANKARKEAARGSKAVKGLGGKRGRLESLASIPGTRAAKAELGALHAQIRALENLLSFALSVADGTREAPMRVEREPRSKSQKAVKKTLKRTRNSAF